MNSYTLEYDMSQSLWVLRDDMDGQVLRAFLSRREATEGDLLHELLGPDVRVRIRNADGSYERDLARVLGVDGAGAQAATSNVIGFPEPRAA